MPTRQQTGEPRSSDNSDGANRASSPFAFQRFVPNVSDMPSWLERSGLVVVLLAVSLGGAVAYWMASRTPELFSSPTESRNTRAFNAGHLGLLESAVKSGDLLRPATAPMLPPERIPGRDGSFVLDFSKEESAPKEPGPARWADGLVGDDRMELAAFATWYPHPEDDFTRPDWQPTPVFRHPETLALLDGPALDALGVPKAFRTMTAPREYSTPKLRLLFRTSGMEQPRILGVNGGAPATEARVTFSLVSLGEVDSALATQGEWTIFDSALLAWHDTPLRLLVEVLTGDPEFATLPPTPGAEAVIGERLRVQWLEVLDGEPDVDAYFYSFAPVDSSPEMKERLDRIEELSRALHVETSDDEEPEPALLIRASHEDYLTQHCGWREADGRVNFGWQREAEQRQVFLASRPMAPGGKPGPVELVLIPRVAELAFEIEGLPDAPNPADVENLFDVVLPRITLLGDTPSESDLIGLIATAAQLAWEHDSRWSGDPPAALPENHTLVNMTAEELLHWYLRNTPGARIRYDREEQMLHVNPDQTDSFKPILEWWDTVRPAWTY